MSSPPMSSPPPAIAIPALADHLGFRLRAVSNHVSQAFAARLEGSGATVAEWVMLRTLHGRDAVAPSRLAADMGLTRGAVTRLADRLIAKGFLARAADPDDGRAQTLALTGAGAALVPDLADRADRNDADTFAALSPAERATLMNLLEKVAQHLRISAPPLD